MVKQAHVPTSPSSPLPPPPGHLLKNVYAFMIVSSWLLSSQARLSLAFLPRWWSDTAGSSRLYRVLPSSQSSANLSASFLRPPEQLYQAYHNLTAIDGRVQDSALGPRERAASTASVRACVAVVLPNGASACVFVKPDDISSSGVLHVSQSEIRTVPDGISIWIAYKHGENLCVDSPAFGLLDLTNVLHATSLVQPSGDQAI